jgi:hypothetical protein
LWDGLYPGSPPPSLPAPVYVFNKLFLSTVENLNIDLETPLMTVELLKKSYVNKIMDMKTIPVTDAEII